MSMDDNYFGPGGYGVEPFSTGKSSSSGVSMLPCDRGMPNGGTRGLHHFQAGSSGVVVCIYCGQRPNQTSLTSTL